MKRYLKNDYGRINMANKNVELMRGEPEKAVKKLAIPIMISMILTALYNIVDGIWVAGLGQPLQE